MTRKNKLSEPLSKGVKGGRVSGEPQDDVLGQITSTASWRQVVPILRELVMRHEEARAYVHDIVDLGGATGFHIELTANSDRTIKRAEERLNEFARRVNADRGGLQYAIHNQFREMATTGALSMESWLSDDLSMVQDIAHVAREEVYSSFDKKLGRYRFFHKPRNYRAGQSTFDYNQGIALPLQTYHHALFEGQGDTADPVPPLLAILDALKQNQDAYRSLTRILRTMGLYGAVIAKVDRPDPTSFDDGMDDPAYFTAIKQRMDAMEQTLKDGAEDALYVYAIDRDRMGEDLIEVKTIGAGGAQNADSISKQIKNRVSTGTSIPGFLHGNPEGISDAYMRVIYPRVLDHVGRFRHMVGGAFESTVRLDLLLGGIPVQGVNWKWKAQKNGYEDRDANARRLHAQADLILYQTYGDVIIPQLAAANGVSAEEMRRSIKHSYFERQLTTQQQHAQGGNATGNNGAGGDTTTPQGETSTDQPRQDRPAKTIKFNWNAERAAFEYDPERLVIYGAGS